MPTGQAARRAAAVALSMAERQAITREMAKRYGRASKKQRGLMLDELCALAGYNRSYAARLLREQARGAAPRRRRRRGRRPVYDRELLAPLTKIWATLGGICGKRVAAAMAGTIAALERHGEVSLTEAQRAQLLAMSARTIDRLLSAKRRRLRLQGRAMTKPGSLLKSQIPVRTFAEWDQAKAGFLEIDLVAHEGGDPRGEFAYSLCCSDVASGWTEPRVVRNRARTWTLEALKDVRASLPFPLLGLDSDNGSEFINAHLATWTAEQKISFSRSRPNEKNDSCFVEQKNWSVIRREVGYGRYDTQAERDLIAAIYADLRLYVNFFLPSMKLIAKERRGARVQKRYDRPATPYQRLLALKALDEATKRRLAAQYLALNPAALRRRLTDNEKKLARMCSLKMETRRKEVAATA
jgi:hypothetical protein